MLTLQSAGDGETELGITVTVDEKERLLALTNKGIGMTSHQHQEFLGTIARSGSKAFMQQLATEEEGGAATSQAATFIIGKFGVGFYSVFMVGRQSRCLHMQAATAATPCQRPLACLLAPKLSCTSRQIPGTLRAIKPSRRSSASTRRVSRFPSCATATSLTRSMPFGSSPRVSQRNTTLLYTCISTTPTTSQPTRWHSNRRTPRH